MPQLLIPLHESNDCHTPAGTPEGGQFCSTGGTGAAPRRKRLGRVTKGPDYRIVFRSQLQRMDVGPRMWPPFFHRGVEAALTGQDQRKLRSARVALIFEPGATAHLGAPIKWVAPNGVTVVYVRGQRRDERTGSGTYHDFNVSGDEAVVPLTRNVGAGRRALRAWAKTHITDVLTARFQARRMVRPGD